MEHYNSALVLAALLSAVAAALHLGIIAGGARWYRFFGAGERFATAAEQGRWFPALVTLGIAAVLFVWAAYALSGAGMIEPLPLLRLGLIAITLVYLVRGTIGAFLLVGTGRSNRFIVVSSIICLGYGLVHLVGVIQMWDRLA
ncbi:MAG: hypothetical protein LBE53_12385 [Paucimonas sp.]|jgi:hypothetical protein|uniref:hypothetical protein n=1 Tax=Pantoea sp. Cy-639 TaxID=2608360 RepID=UPI001420BC7E|nr:hypothetical protein [Pantoea sp. Cy-639]MDR2307977.1 hypothetical protein [Paucimonas sp.]NIF16602.1 hypothetical protein [Pantoea sp. Cy-639]